MTFSKSGSAAPKPPLLATSSDEWPEDWSKDGRYLAYGFSPAAGSFDLSAVPLSGDRTPIPIAHGPFIEDEPRFSFDGRWVAYNSNESGTFQVYLVSFPVTGHKRQVSTNGGVQPRWRRDGVELYYLAPDGNLMAVGMRQDPMAELDAARPLFNTGLNPDPGRDQFAVSPDGQRFLIQLPVREGAPTPITVVLNWTAALRK